MTDVPNSSQIASPSLSAKDYGANTLAAILKGIPYIGAMLHQFIFGPGAERRMLRIEHTLAEIGSQLEMAGAVPTVDSEEFVSLLERTGLTYMQQLNTAQSVSAGSDSTHDHIREGHACEHNDRAPAGHVR